MVPGDILSDIAYLLLVRKWRYSVIVRITIMVLYHATLSRGIYY